MQLPKLSDAEIRQLQRNDPDLAPIIRLLERKHCKTPHKAYDFFFISDGLFFHYTTSHPTQIRQRTIEQLCVPRFLIATVMTGMHESHLTNCHMGFEKTLQRIRQQYFWFAMNLDRKKFAASCNLCQTRKRPTYFSRSTSPQTSEDDTPPTIQVSSDINPRQNQCSVFSPFYDTEEISRANLIICKSSYTNSSAPTPESTQSVITHTHGCNLRGRNILGRVQPTTCTD